MLNFQNGMIFVAKCKQNRIFPYRENLHFVQEKRVLVAKCYFRVF